MKETPKTHATLLWNIAISAAVKTFNGEMSDEEYEQETVRFTKELDEILKKTESKNTKPLEELY